MRAMLGAGKRVGKGQEAGRPFTGVTQRAGADERVPWLHRGVCSTGGLALAPLQAVLSGAIENTLG